MDNLTMPLQMNTVKIAIIVTFCALSIGTDYALVGVFNVKPMDLIVFIGGFLFGPVVGSSIGVFSWLIYGTLNPYGFEPRIWLATMFAESVYGITGGLLRKALGSTSLDSQRLRLSVLFATMGFLPTVIYDMITNIVYAPVYNQPVIVALLVGAPAAVVHEGANFLIFGVCSVPTILALRKVVKGWQIRP
jgi:LytS/YehU family sensor histidine kinase